MPSTFTDLGIWHCPMFLRMLLLKGSAKWACREARGPLPVACACRVKPTNATCIMEAVLLQRTEALSKFASFDADCHISIDMMCLFCHLPTNCTSPKVFYTPEAFLIVNARKISAECTEFLPSCRPGARFR